MAIVHVTGENYEKEVLQSDKPVLIDFWASWCGPCQMLGPVIEEVSEEVTDVKFVKVSTEEAPELAEKTDFRTSEYKKLKKLKKIKIFVDK